MVQAPNQEVLEIDALRKSLAAAKKDQFGLNEKADAQEAFFFIMKRLSETFTAADKASGVVQAACQISWSQRITCMLCQAQVKTKPHDDCFFQTLNVNEIIDIATQNAKHSKPPVACSSEIE